MKRSQADRAVIAARATQNSHRASRSTGAGTVGTNPGLRAQTTVTGTGPVRRTTCAPLTSMQRDSEGKRSAWAASPYYFTDPAWSQTVSNQSTVR